MSKPVPEPRNLIDGDLVPASDGGTFDNLNPATEESLGFCADATAEDMERAIAAARRAADETHWSTDPAFRQRCLEQLHQALVDEREELRKIVVAEAGSPIVLTYAVQLDHTIASMPYWSELAGSYEYEREMADIEFMGQRQRRLLRREAVGVVGAITPWNFPLYLNLCKLAPALATGNTIVLKPAPDTPWCATSIGRLIAERTEIPPGVVNIVASSDHELGALLSKDPRVDLVTFTGSTATGRKVMQNASTTIKKVFLELGGKSAMVVLDDVELEKVIPFATVVCTHAGQGCALQSRILLPRSKYEEGLERLTEAFRKFPYGDPCDPSVLMGPQVSKTQQQRVLSYIETAEREGARILTGGGVPSQLERGFYVEPTLLADVDPDSTVAQEEIFGPVLCAIPFEDDDDAVRIANNSIYGLSGGVSSGSEERALAVARRIRTGTLSVNGAQWFDVDTPFGGYRQSGLGRENGLQGFEEYLETKVLALPG